MSRLTALERFAARSRRTRSGPRCELCSAAVAEHHRHVVDRTERRLLCACTACVLLFPAHNGSRYRGVPTRARLDSSCTFTDADLAGLGVPVGLAFFFRAESLDRWVAVFPSPAGSTEADLPDGAWQAFADVHPAVRSMQDDVEALLVHRKRSGETIALVAPIDACYALTAVLRQSWRGIDGGDEARAAIDEFLRRLASEAVPS